METTNMSKIVEIHRNINGASAVPEMEIGPRQLAIQAGKITVSVNGNAEEINWSGARLVFFFVVCRRRPPIYISGSGTITIPLPLSVDGRPCQSIFVSARTWIHKRPTHLINSAAEKVRRRAVKSCLHHSSSPLTLVHSITIQFPVYYLWPRVFTLPSSKPTAIDIDGIEMKTKSH